MNLLSGINTMKELTARETAVAKNEAVEIKDGFLLFHTLSPARQTAETFEEYTFRRKITKKSIKKHFKR